MIHSSTKFKIFISIFTLIIFSSNSIFAQSTINGITNKVNNNEQFINNANLEIKTEEVEIETLTISYNDFLERNINNHQTHNIPNNLFVENLVKVSNNQKNSLKAKEILKIKRQKYLMFIPKVKISSKFKKFIIWLKTKDKDYYRDNQKATQIRKDWERWLGIDVFHLYYKYQEAEKIVKKKTSFETPKMFGKMKVSPEYKSGKITITIHKKF